MDLAEDILGVVEAVEPLAEGLRELAGGGEAGLMIGREGARGDVAEHRRRVREHLPHARPLCEAERGKVAPVDPGLVVAPLREAAAKSGATGEGVGDNGGVERVACSSALISRRRCRIRRA